MAEKNKLNAEQKTFVLKSLAEFDSLGTIQSNLGKIYEVHVSKQNIWAYKERYAKEVEKLREAYLNEVAQEAGYHKRWRLQKATRMIQSITDSHDPAYYGTACKLLELCRRETEVIGGIDHDVLNHRFKELVEILQQRDTT